MRVSVIICTYNRSHNLGECLSKLENQEIPNNIDWEVNIVDNNSTDETKSFLNDYVKVSKLNINYFFEEQQGLSFARNTGIKCSKGEYLIFIDDDIRVTPNWLNTIVTTFEKQNCDGVGGRIHIESPESLPTWITPELYGFLGHQDFGPLAHVMDNNSEFPFGGNMAIKKHVVDKIGYFNVNLGRKGEGFKKEELFKGEETEFFDRLTKAGGTCFYHPDALVYHKILPHQLRRSFFLRLHNNAGILQAKNDQSYYKRHFLGIPLFVIPQLFRALWRYMVFSFSSGFDNSFRQMMNIYYFLGMIEGYLNIYFKDLTPRKIE